MGAVVVDSKPFGGAGLVNQGVTAVGRGHGPVAGAGGNQKHLEPAAEGVSGCRQAGAGPGKPPNREERTQVRLPLDQLQAQGPSRVPGQSGRLRHPPILFQLGLEPPHEEGVGERREPRLGILLVAETGVERIDSAREERSEPPGLTLPLDGVGPKGSFDRHRAEELRIHSLEGDLGSPEPTQQVG